MVYSVQEHQASVGADISTLQGQLADLIQQVISDAGEADAKPQRRADALSAATGATEAVQRLLPASGQPAGQPALDGRAGELAEAAAQQLAGLGPNPGKVEPRNVCAGCSASLSAWQETCRLLDCIPKHQGLGCGHWRKSTWVDISFELGVQVGNQLKRLEHVLRKAAGQPKAVEYAKQQHKGPELATSGAEGANAKQQKRKAASSNGEMPRKAKGSEKKQKA